MASISVLPNWPARMSHYGECDIDAEGAGKATGTQQLTGGAHDSGPGGHVDGSERTPHQAHPGGLQRGGSSRTRSRSSWTPSTQQDTGDVEVRGAAPCSVSLLGDQSHSSERAAQGARGHRDRSNHAAAHTGGRRPEEPTPPSAPPAPRPPAADAPRGHADTDGRQPPPWRQRAGVRDARHGHVGGLEPPWCPGCQESSRQLRC